MLNQENFSFALPEMNLLPPKKLEQADLNFKTLQDTTQKSLVLVYSKDVDTRFLFKTFLTMLDFDVAEAENEIEMMEMFAIKHPDLILMDVDFPFADSISAMNELQKNNLFAKVPFVLLSGFAQKGCRTAAFAAGAAEYLIKPIDFDLLECSLQLILSDTRNNVQGGCQ